MHRIADIGGGGQGGMIAGITGSVAVELNGIF